MLKKPKKPFLLKKWYYVCTLNYKYDNFYIRNDIKIE